MQNTTLSFNAVLSEARNIFKKHFRKIMLTMLLAYVPIVVIGGGVVLFSFLSGDGNPFLQWIL
jgi:hypothetical protein